MKRGKRYQDSVKLFDKAALYDPEQAVDTCLKTANAKFDETIELSVKLGVDPRHADQQVVFWCLPKARRPRKPRKLARIM